MIPLIFNLGIKWRWVVSFTPRGRQLHYTLNKRTFGSRAATKAVSYFKLLYTAALLSNPKRVVVT